MGFFDRFKKTQKPAAISASWSEGAVLAPVEGKVIPLSEVSDVVFASGAMGKGVGIEPAGEVVYAPVSGELLVVGAPNYHALAMKADDGAEILIHVGVDTVEMKGEGFEVFGTKGTHVQAGEPLLSFSADKIRAAGHDTVVIMSITNSDDYVSVEQVANGDAKAGDKALTYTK